MRIVYREDAKRRVVRFRDIPSGDTFRLEKGTKIMMATATWRANKSGHGPPHEFLGRNAVYLETGHLSFVHDDSVVIPIETQLEVL